MLVLTRKIGEQIIIGDNIKVTLVSVGPGRVKIGIEAPAWVSVDRAEIHEKKQAEQPPEPTAITGEPVGPPVPAAGSEAPAGLHNRIAAKLPPAPVAAESVPAGNVNLRPRLPRKPR